MAPTICRCCRKPVSASPFAPSRRSPPRRVGASITPTSPHCSTRRGIGKRKSQRRIAAVSTGREGGAVPKAIAVLGSALFFAVAPSSVAGLVPWWITHWEFRPPFFDLEATRAVGILLIVAGLPGLVDSFARFALQGLGTPAPIAPTQNLVVTGLYRYVRNPIYVALVAVILGQAALFGDQRFLLYGVLVWLAFHAFVVGYEEPALVHRFGTEYEDFRANVPRWIPRLTPWRAARRQNHS